MSGGGGNTTTVERADPWSGQQPFLLRGFNAAGSILDNPPEYYPGQQVADLTLEQNVARAMGGATAAGYERRRDISNQANEALLGGGIRPQADTSLTGYGLTVPLQQAAAGPQGASAIGDRLLRERYNDVGGLATFQDFRDVGGLQGFSRQAGTTDYGGLRGLTGGASFADAGGLSGFQQGASNPYTDAAVGTFARDAAINFERSVLPAIRRQSIAAGQGGGTRQAIAEGIAAGDVGRAITDRAADFQRQAYESNQGRALQSAQALQAAYEQAQGRGLTAGQTLQSAFESQRDRQLQAGTAAQQAYEQARSRGLSAAEAQQAAYNAVKGRQLTAAQGLDQYDTAARQRALQAALGLSGERQFGAGLIQQGKEAGQQFALGQSGAINDAVARGLALAPQTALTPYQEAQQLFSLGAPLQAQRQAEIEADRARFDFEQNLPFLQASRYLPLVQGNYGGVSQTTAPGRSPIQGALGGAALGGGLVGGLGAAGLSLSNPVTAALIGVPTLLGALG